VVDGGIQHAQACVPMPIAGVRFDSTETGNNMSAMLAYGTTVTITTA